MPVCQVHNVGFYSSEPKAIYSMALEKIQNKLAVARSDASIEIWNLSHLPFIERTIPSNLENFSIEGLTWYGSRLFSVGLHGFLVEFDLFSLSVKNKWAITGEAGTCLDSNKTHIAIGTEQGYINLYQVTENGVEFEKFLDKQEGRIICLRFDKSGAFVVGGSINAIRIWNVRTGHAIHKMVLGRSEAKKDTVVWCLEVLSDFTIFSGDSRGVLTLWDGKIGAQIESYQSHKADITAICLDENEESIYSAGVDPLISNYEKVKIGSNFKWVKSIQRKIHDHDVRALIFHKGKLYSAGVDSYLVCSYHPPKTLIKYAPILQSPCVQVSAKKNRILLRYSTHIEIWQLGGAKRTSDDYRGVLELASRPKKLAVIQKLGKNWAEEDEPEGIFCSSISDSGDWVLLGTSSGFRLYSLISDPSQKASLKLEKVDLDDNEIPCVQAVFNDHHNQLIVASNNGSIIVYDLEDGNPFVTQKIERNEEYLTDTVSILTVSSCGKYLVAADSKSNIVVFSYTEDEYTFQSKLPRYKVPPTALNINSQTSCIVVVYADSKVCEYDLKKKMYTSFGKQLEILDSWKSKTHPIRSVAFDRRTNAVFLHDDSNIIIVHKDEKSPDLYSASKIAKKHERNSLVNGINNSSGQLKTTVIQKYKHLVHLASMPNGNLVAVEVNPLSILEKLPPAFAQKTFGSK